MNLQQIDGIARGRLGRIDAACPMCGPERRAPTNRARKVLRIWRLDEGFASFHCARCGEGGYARDDSAPAPDPARLEVARVEAAARERAAACERLQTARWLWSQRSPIAGTPAETYLRVARGYGGRLPATLGYLPGRGEFPPAMIAPFGIPTEPEPGTISIADGAVTGVHLTRIAPDGSGKAGTDRDKIMVGRSLGSPIALAPANDLLGLVIAEGIEDALSAHEATGLGAWAAGAASRLPALAAAIPSYVESVTILIDPDPDGRRHAGSLGDALRACGIEVKPVLFGVEGTAA